MCGFGCKCVGCFGEGTVVRNRVEVCVRVGERCVGLCVSVWVVLVRVR